MTALAASGRRAPSSLLFLLAVGDRGLSGLLGPAACRQAPGSGARRLARGLDDLARVLSRRAPRGVRRRPSACPHARLPFAPTVRARNGLDPGLPLAAARRVAPARRGAARRDAARSLVACDARPGGGSGLRCHVTRDTHRLVVARALGPSRARPIPISSIRRRTSGAWALFSPIPSCSSPWSRARPSAWRTASSSWGSSGCLRSWFGLPSRTPRPISDAPSRGRCPAPDECWRSPAFPPRFSSRSTVHISTDVASAPLLWVAPLVVYLADLRDRLRPQAACLPPHRGDRGHHRARRSRAARGPRAVRCLGGARAPCSGSS